MNVLLFSNLFPSRDAPARGVFNLHGFEPLGRMCNVRVIVPVSIWQRLSRPAQWFHAPAERHGGLQVTYPTYWNLPRIMPAMNAAVMYRSIRAHAWRAHRKAAFDGVVGSFAYPDTVVAARLARDFGCPLVALVLGSDINELARNVALRPQITEALSQAVRVVALTSGLRDGVLALGVPDRRVIIRHNGVDGSRFVIQRRDDARRQVDVAADGPLVCFVGNLVHEKGPDVLVEALALLRAARKPAARAVFVGDGDLKPSLVTRVGELGLGDRVAFAGRRAPEEIPRWISAADVLCLPSRREGCPNVVLEALASGRPVVASAVGGVPELLSDRNGLMVPADDPSALARGLDAALDRDWDPADLRGSVPALTWDAFSRTFYEELVAAGPHA
jgi:glycosyltransferase involved in cell wall biosynthesis